MKKKSIFICEQCSSRNYFFYLPQDREKMMTLKKYCSFCNSTTNHLESK